MSKAASIVRRVMRPDTFYLGQLNAEHLVEAATAFSSKPNFLKVSAVMVVLGE